MITPRFLLNGKTIFTTSNTAVLFAWGVNLIPYWYVGGLVVVVFVAVLLARLPIFNEWASPFAIFTCVFYTCILYSIAFLIIIANFTGVESEMTFDMEWSLGEPVDYLPECDHIVLQFKDHPSYAVGIYSTNLAEYLKTLPGDDVRVTFAVTRDFGRTRGFYETRIGDLTRWNIGGGYYSSRGDGSESPFR